LRTDSLHISDAPLGLTWCSWLLTCAHTAWTSSSAPLLFCTFGKVTMENLWISRGQLALCQEKRIERRQTVRSAGCKVLAPNAGFLLASMPSDCRYRPKECFFSQSVSVSVPRQISGISNTHSAGLLKYIPATSEDKPVHSWTPSIRRIRVSSYSYLPKYMMDKYP